MKPGLAWLPMAGVLLAGLLAMAAAALHLWPTAQANWMSMPAMAQVRQWQRAPAKPPSAEAWLQVRAQLDQALARSPASAELNEAMAYLYLSAALRPGQPTLVQQAYLGESLRFLQPALQARPMAATTWANQALALHALDRLQPLGAAEQAQLWASFDHAHRLGQREAGVQQTLGRVAFGRWASLSPQRQQAMQSLMAQATPEQLRPLQAQAKADQVRGF